MIARRPWPWHQKVSPAYCWESAAPIHLGTSTGEHSQTYWSLWHSCSKQMCMSNIYGLDYVLEVPDFLLNKHKKGKDYFRENWPPLRDLLNCQTQLIAKGNSVLDGLDLPSQAKCLKPHWGSAYIRQWSITAILGERITRETVKYTNTELMTLAICCTDSLWCMKHPGK